MKPKIEQIRKNSKARFRVINNTGKALKSKYTGLQRKLYSLLLGRIINRLQIDDNGLILPSNRNKILIANSGFINRFLDKNATPSIIKLLNKSFKDLNNLAFEKGAMFGNVRNIKGRINKKTDIVLGLKPRGGQEGGFFSRMRNDRSVFNKIRANLNFGLSAQISIDAFKRQIRQLTLGTESQLGVIANFQELTMQSGSATENYDRFIQDEYSKALSLNYAIYQGGEIESSRPFCMERNGNVYAREEILNWQNEVWEGKKTPHNIILDCGGYNCRHYYDWISYELAVQLRPGLSRSQFDFA